MKLKAFIGSSSETLNVANALKHNLAPNIDCFVWKDSFFSLSQTTLETLIERVEEFDLGIFVFGADDEISSRGKQYHATRDNVIYEHGLFCGRLGPNRTFVVRSEKTTLKWLSDLDGFAPAKYSDIIAASNADLAVRDACDQIRNSLPKVVPRCGVYFAPARKSFPNDWWTYGGTEPSSAIIGQSGIHFQTSVPEIGLMYPRFDNLHVHGRYCFFRFKPTLNPSSTRFYISVVAGTLRIKLAFCDSHDEEGWGTPNDEFMIRLPYVETNQFKAVGIDLEALNPYMGEISAVNGFRLRPGIEVSHLGVCDQLPLWLPDIQMLQPMTAPVISIDQPSDGGEVRREHTVSGTIKRNHGSASSDLQVFVLAPNNFWYRQSLPTIKDGRWSVKALFGSQESGAGLSFSIAAVTTRSTPFVEKVVDLPQASAKATIIVIRLAD